MTTTTVDTAALVAAAEGLSRAARYDLAATLLDSADPADPAVAVARADVAVAAAYATGDDVALPYVEAAEQALSDGPDPVLRWDLDFARLRRNYANELFVNGFGPAGRTAETMATLRGQAEQLHASAPDSRRQGWGAQYLGFVADNIYGERELAPKYYAEALAAHESTGDDLLGFEALRHLGDHAHDDGDAALAREQWQRSADLAARAGAVRSTLAQQILIAVLARDAGNEAGATALATEIARWTGAAGMTRQHAQVLDFLAGTDITGPPAEEE